MDLTGILGVLTFAGLSTGLVQLIVFYASRLLLSEDTKYRLKKYKEINDNMNSILKTISQEKQSIDERQRKIILGLINDYSMYVLDQEKARRQFDAIEKVCHDSAIRKKIERARIILRERNEELLAS